MQTKPGGYLNRYQDYDDAIIRYSIEGIASKHTYIVELYYVNVRIR